jgi:hypothetical protein
MALPVLLTDSDIHTPTRIYTLFPIQTRRIPVYSGFARTIAYSIAQNSFQYEGDRVVHVPPLPRKKQSHFDGQPGTAVPGVVRYISHSSRRWIMHAVRGNDKAGASNILYMSF